MNSSSTSEDMSLLTTTIRESLASGASQESVIQMMRLAGLHQIACIKMLRDVTGVSLGDAKEAVHYSKAWADRRESNEGFHEAAFATAKEFGFLEVNS